MEWLSLVPIAAILAGAIVLVIALRRFMRARLRDHPVRPEEAPAEHCAASLTAEEQEYLDSSHIISRPPAHRR
ncbi:MAG: hypothetical protein IT522_17775 [Burkholderiales bacterium]|nr:hypothetical protein [Burkholderiales bacterium]